LSPSLTSHLASVPSSMVGESAGILSSMGMRACPERLARLKANAPVAVKSAPKLYSPACTYLRFNAAHPLQWGIRPNAPISS
jgi:hypothetical protein